MYEREGEEDVIDEDSNQLFFVGREEEGRNTYRACICA